MNKTSFLVAATAACAIGVVVVGAKDPRLTPSGDGVGPSPTGELKTTAGAATYNADNVSFAPVAESNAVVRETDIPVDYSTAPIQVTAGSQVGPTRADMEDSTDEDAPKARSPRAKMSGQVAELVAAGGTGVAEIVVRYDHYPQLLDDDRVAELGGIVTRTFETLEMRVVQIPVASLEELATEENVDWLSLDNRVSTLSASSREAANVPTSASSNAAYSGAGVGIAVIDTGVSNHGDLADNILQYNFLGGRYPTPVIENGQIVDFADDNRQDQFGHGTHVAGILAGDGVDSQDEFKGSATSAKVLALQVLDMHGAGSMSDVMASLDWLLTYGAYFDIRVVNLSLGMSIAESNETDPLVLAVERLWDAGMVVIVAAGNNGFDGHMTVTSPGNSRKVITVGSVTDNGTGFDFSDDYVSSFSSRGPTIGDYVLKPDLLAPGNRLVAAIPPDAKMRLQLPSRARACSSSGCSSEYLELSGTSMASPMVSAAVALMLQKDPTLSPATVKARLMRSARKIDADPTAAGAGVLDADAAMSETATVTGEALSPLMLFDDASGGVLIEDTAALWGDAIWGAGYLFNGGFDWTEGAYNASSAVNANGYLWTDGGVSAKGYLWTDGGVSAKGYLWTDGIEAKSLLEDSGAGLIINDD